MTLRIHILALLALVPAALFAWSDVAPRHAGASSGVLNTGFEDGVLGGLPVAWTATQPVPDEVVVTDTEDASDFAAYADMGNIVVAPYRGQRMLRLGRPKALDSVAYACDTTNDTDADNLSICAEAAIGTDPADVDTDGDGCADGEEVLGASPVFGGQRDPLDFWDFFDVTGDQEIDLGDATEILSRFGTPAGSGGIYDRDILDSIHPWATSAGSNGIDLTDVLNNLVSFGHSCTAPP